MARRIGRRVFLCGAGGVALALPILPSLLPKTTRAQTVETKRFVALCSFSGQIASHWLPTRTPPGYVLHDAMYSGSRADGTTMLRDAIPGGGPATSAPLTDFTGGLSEILASELDPFLPKLTLIRGVDMLPYLSHNYGGMLGNYGSQEELPHIPTIDQVLAYSSRFYPVEPHTRSLHVGTGFDATISYTDYGIAGGEVEQQNCARNPHSVWSDLFEGFSPSTEPREDPNRSLMNAIHEDYRRLTTHRRLSTDDRALLERHMTFLSGIERSLEALPVTCTAPTEPPSISIADTDMSDAELVRTQSELLVDLSVAALRCGLTRIVTYSADKALTDVSGSWRATVHNSDGVEGDWHTYAHAVSPSEPEPAQHLLSINRYIAREVFLRFLTGLDVEEAEGRTYLDNSLVYWGNEMGYNHNNHNVPVLFAGSAGGALATGRYLDYCDWNDGYAANVTGWGIELPGVTHNRLLATILQAMGLEPSDYERDGVPGYGAASRAGWPDGAGLPSYDYAQNGTPLPGLFLG